MPRPKNPSRDQPIRIKRKKGLTVLQYGNLGRICKSIRLSRQHTLQQAVLAIGGLSQATLSKIENGSHTPTRAVAYRMVQYIYPDCLDISEKDPYQGISSFELLKNFLQHDQTLNEDSRQQLLELYQKLSTGGL